MEKYEARVVKSTRKLYQVMTTDGKRFDAVLRGKVVEEDQEQVVRVGDYVRIVLENSQLAVIEEILPRKTILSRGRGYKKHIIAVNMDQIFIMMSTRNPYFRTSLLDRYLIIAERNRIPAVIGLNKIDLEDPAKFDIYRQYYSGIGYPFHLISATKGIGMEAVRHLFRGKVTSIIGHSGTGKSSLVKVLQPDLHIRIGEVSGKTGKGTHTTTHVEMYYLPNVDGYIIDTPGIKELGIGDILKSELKEYFVDFHPYEARCSFSNCMHISEPGCAVRQASEQGEILKDRYTSYLAIYKDLPSQEFEWEQGKVRPV